MTILPTTHPTPALLPTAFRLGAATSAAQIEGSVPGDGKGASIWDAFCATPGKIKDGTNIDVACNHLQRMPQDVERMRWLGLDAYRFSFAWPRVQPAGQGAWNETGLAFYDRLIDTLLEAGIAPHATLHHWDLPQALQESVGGWQSRDTAAHFADYAAEVARRFGDRLVAIATLNEPWCVATLGYQTGQFAPGIKSRAAAMQVSHHLLLGHGLALQAMRAVATGNGAGHAPQLGIVLNHTPAFAAEKTPADLHAARIDDGLDVRWYMDPLFRGAYPADAIEHLGADAPVIEPGDMAVIRQPMDFLGVNFYTRHWISKGQPPIKSPAPHGFSDMGWEIYPEALTQHLVRLTRDYMPPPMLITENGMANADVVVDGQVDDAPRVAYLRDHLAAVARAIELGADVRGYFYWSLLDNFEWDSGYAKRFGLFRTDYETQERTPKASAHWYRDFIAQHKLSR